MGLDDDTIDRAKRLLGAERTRAFQRGDAPVLLSAFEGPVVQAVAVERADAYVTLLYALLLLRRGHELEPLHEDLFRLVLPAQLAHEPAYDAQLFAQDLAQLQHFGCIERRTEPLKIRGYKDIRRERYRYRLTEDAVALVEWLEARLAARLQGGGHDSRDLLTDVLGHLKELKRLLEHWRAGNRSPDAPRRAIYLLTAVDDAVHAISEELLTFRAAMHTFASQPYDLAELRRILAWLERYVRVYLESVQALRGEIVGRLDEISKPRFLRALAECEAALRAEQEQTPRALRGTSSQRSVDDLLDAQRPFFAEEGQLSALCLRIDDSARAVLRKMSRHLRELERRSARIGDLRRRIEEMAVLPPDPDRRLGAYINALIGSAHGRFGQRGWVGPERVAPPLPRSHRAPAIKSSTSRPLRRKRSTMEEVRALRARRLHELAAWLDEHVLAGKPEVRLSAAKPATQDAPRRWVDVARARHLAQGRSLRQLDVTIDAVDGPAARLGDEQEGLDAPDCIIRKGGAS